MRAILLAVTAVLLHAASGRATDIAAVSDHFPGDLKVVTAHAGADGRGGGEAFETQRYWIKFTIDAVTTTEDGYLRMDGTITSYRNPLGNVPISGDTVLILADPTTGFVRFYFGGYSFDAVGLVNP